MIPESSNGAAPAAHSPSERSCPNKSIGLIQAASGAGNMNQSLSPGGFSLVDWDLNLNRGESAGEDQSLRLVPRQGDGIDVAAVVRLGAMGGAAIGEKSGRIGVGAQTQILDLVDPSKLEPHGDIAGEIEHGVAIAGCRCEKPMARGVLCTKPDNKIGSDLIARLPDHRADRRADLAAC